jgi:hypothetical protein
MEVTSKIYFEQNVFIKISLKNGYLDYELDCNEDKYSNEDISTNFNIYEKNDNGMSKYNNIMYNNIKYSYSSILRRKPLKEGIYLFVFKTTKIIIEFAKNNVSYKLENAEVEDDPDIR